MKLSANRAFLGLLLASVVSLQISCAKPSTLDEACTNCSETALNAPIEGEDPGFSEAAPPEMIETTPALDPIGKANSKYAYVDPKKIVPAKPLEIALKYYDTNLSRITNKNYLTVIDFTQHSSKRRKYVIDMRTGAVTAMLTTVGRASDPDGDGYATSFSNTPESNKSSLGFYLTANQYQGKHGTSMRLHGLSSTNSNAYSRAIVVHGADYVQESNSYAGRSLGCPAVDNRLISDLVNKLKNGSLMYIWHAKLSTER